MGFLKRSKEGVITVWYQNGQMRGQIKGRAALYLARTTETLNADASGSLQAYLFADAATAYQTQQKRKRRVAIGLAVMNTGYVD